MNAPETNSEPARLEADIQRSLRRSVPCGGCGRLLSYPTTLSRGHTILSCGRCGTLTTIPSQAIRLLKLSCLLFLLVAVALIYLCLQRPG